MIIVPLLLVPVSDISAPVLSAALKFELASFVKSWYVRLGSSITGGK
jgi:hypothetical protein